MFVVSQLAARIDAAYVERLCERASERGLTVSRVLFVCGRPASFAHFVFAFFTAAELKYYNAMHINSAF